MAGVDIKETVEDKKTDFNIKRFRILSASFDKPEKTLDMKDVSKDNFDNSKAKGYPFKIAEVSKKITQFESIQGLLKETDAKRVDEFFQKKVWQTDKLRAINFTLNFNPYQYVKKIDEISGFYNFYYPYSDILFVPNIRKNRLVTPNHKEEIISMDDYLRFVDESYEILNKKNNKTIFVPVSLSLSAIDIDNLVKHYLHKEYYYFWLDFGGKAINERNTGIIRHFNDRITDSGNFDKILTYFTNIRREISSNIKSDKSPASDILASISGANIIGVNREPQRPINDYHPPSTDELIRHKSRLFDGSSYYYKKSRRTTPNKNINTLDNSVLLNNEFKVQADHFLKNLEIATLLEQKAMLKEYRGGNVLKSLESKSTSKQKSLLQWY